MNATWPGGDAIGEPRRWLRDLGALLALPALWVDHEPIEITEGLLSVLFSILGLKSGYARFDDPDKSRTLETWRPSGPSLPTELQLALQADELAGSGVRSMEAGGGELGSLRVASVPLTLPWGTSLVLVAANRSDFPTRMESHLLGTAVGQAAIAIHTARRLARADEARASAEHALSRQNEALRSLVVDVEPALKQIIDRVHAASRLVPDVDASEPAATPYEPNRHRAATTDDSSAAPPLTRREVEVLGLLAQGLSNKEIAGVMWLSYRTVERHVTSLYRKIGVARRSEATAFALRKGVI
jgi:DNA-binding NarL/FixJ family response regulator